ncbi:MAG: hypothetical protein AAF716_22220, partial [Cyanobacteria bacterium P01_D01_bin.1]
MGKGEDDPKGLIARKMASTTREKMAVRLINESSDTLKAWPHHRTHTDLFVADLFVTDPFVTDLSVADPSVRMEAVHEV